MKSYKKTGFIPDKYDIAKTDGTPIAEGAEYFVLRIDRDGDPNAVRALLRYAESVAEENPQFATEILYQLYLLGSMELLKEQADEKRKAKR